MSSHYKKYQQKISNFVNCNAFNQHGFKTLYEIIVIKVVHALRCYSMYFKELAKMSFKNFFFFFNFYFLFLSI
jgi:hypothetical protein